MEARRPGLGSYSDSLTKQLRLDKSLNPSPLHFSHSSPPGREAERMQPRSQVPGEKRRFLFFFAAFVSFLLESRLPKLITLPFSPGTSIPASHRARGDSPVAGRPRTHLPSPLSHGRGTCPASRAGSAEPASAAAAARSLAPAQKRPGTGGG